MLSCRVWYRCAVVSLSGKKCLFPYPSFLVHAFICRQESFRWVYVQINMQQHLERSYSLQAGSVLLVVIWIISMLYALHHTSINFSEAFIMLEVTSLFKDHACLLVLDMPQDNTPVTFRWSNVALTVRQWMFQSELQLDPHFTLVFTCAMFLPISTVPFGLGHSSVHIPSCSILVFDIWAGHL